MELTGQARQSDGLGRYYTRESVGDLLVASMRVPSPRTVIDLGAGNGALVHAAAKVWTQAKFLTVDIDARAGSRELPEVRGRAFRHYVGDALHARLGDTLGLKAGKACAAVCNPPYIRPRWRSHFAHILEDVGLSGVLPQAADMPADILFVAQNLRLLKPGGRLGIILPDGLITGERFGEFRRALLEQHAIQKAIELPISIFSRTEAKAHILVLTKGRRQRSDVLLSRLGPDGLLCEAVQIEPEQAVSRLDYTYHVAQRRRKHVNGRAKKTVGDLVDGILRGKYSSRSRLELPWPVFHTTDFSVQAMTVPNRFVVPRKATSSDLAVAAEAGDVLVARVGRNLSEKICMVRKGPVLVSDCILVLRPKPGCGDSLLAALTTAAGRAAIEAAAHGVGARFHNFKRASRNQSLGMNARTQETETRLEATLQQRADYIPLEDLLRETADGGDLFHTVHKELTNRALRTIVGPRGCGKTHMMRYAWLSCRDDTSQPFAIYVSFNRYFRLEPLLSSHAGAIQQFHSWVLGRTLLALLDSAQEWAPRLDLARAFPSPLNADALQRFVARIERNQPLDEDAQRVSDALSIETVQSLIDEGRKLAERKFAVLLMDDAALTLTPEYLIEFLDIVRSLKSIQLAPKASVYPGTTEVSPRFHQGQDSVPIPVWLCVENPDYDRTMDAIAHTRVKGFDKLSAEVRAMLRFAAFGIPRAYLTMLDEYQRGGFTTAQQGATRIVQEHLDARLAEFRSLGKKVPKLEALVGAGEAVLEGMVKELKLFNEALASKGEKQLTYGVNQDELTYIVERMFNLMVEAGLVYDNDIVKHGTPSRIYRRYIPHAARLLSVRAIGLSGSGGSMRQTVEAIALPSTKHPVRKALQRVVDVDLASLSLSLPKCSKCSTRRLTDNQRFCHNCGQQLVDASTFSQCLEMEIAQVPGLTDWQRTQINEHLPMLKTLGDFLAKQDPAAALLTVRGFGKRRTTKIVDVLNSFVDDYLS